MEIQTNQPMPSEEPKSKTNLILIILVVVLLLGNAATAYFLLNKPKSEQIENVNTTVDVDNENIDTNAQNSTSTDDFIASVPPANVVQITATWNEWPVVSYDFWSSNYQDVYNLAQKAIDEQKFFVDNASDFMAAFSFLKLGTINSGQYSGKDLYLVNLPPEGMGFSNRPLRVIKNDTEYIVIGQQSFEPGNDFYKKIFKFDNNLYISNLETPEKIKVPNSRFYIYKSKSEEPGRLLTNYENPTKLFVFGDNQEVYRDKLSNCFLVRAADGTVREYYYDLDFAQIADQSSGMNIDINDQVIDFNWLDGTPNTNKYAYKLIGGCGASACYNFANYIKNADQLKEVGKNKAGESIYELKDINLKADASAKTSILQSIYDMYYPGYDEKTRKPLPKISFQEFLNKHPLLYWQEPFGGYVVFTNTEFLPAVECGKPVIYLYPTKTTTVSVKVSPTGGFSKTEPNYDNGWRVLAEPNGDLYNYADKKTYPYLFWEGYGLNYDIPKEGFVVARSEVKEFLEEKLAAQGLNAKESAEFIEFWWPRMQADPYYFVTFVPQSEFDKLAPLEVSPKPDTVIRVFMDYQALSAPIEVSEQKLSTPKRQGFTVVEWGGALHK